MNKANGASSLSQCILFYLLSSTDVSALELTADMYTTAEYSNNVALSSTATDEDITQAVGLNVLLKENRKRFNADASFNLEEEHYYNNTFSDQTSLTTGFGIFNFDIVENFLDWRTSFTRTEVLRNASESDTPDNREQRNIFRTGPSITYRVSRESILKASSNYTLVENSDEDASDSKRISGNVSYNYAMNSITSFSVSSRYDEILDGDGGDELKNTNFNFGLRRAYSQGELNFNYGRTQTRSDSSNTVEGNFFNLSISRKQVLWHDVVMLYQQDISDTSIGFEVDEQNADTDNDSNAIGAEATSALDIITRKRLNLEVSRIVGAYQYTVTGFWENESYETLSNDERSRGMSLIVNQNVAQNLKAGVLYRFALNDFVDLPSIGKDKSNTFRLNGDYQWTESLSFRAYLQYATRANSRNQEREYEEFATGMTINWKLL